VNVNQLIWTLLASYALILLIIIAVALF